ncbi:MAG TPA: type II secretion system F family protein, partial [Nitrospiria bacterium]|nr:type II secretion system F family protein [Nitrospiria bacterium]
MATFVWTGKTRQGAVQKGEIAAKSREEVVGLLRRQNIMVTSVKSKSAGLSFNFGGGSVGDRDIVIFTRQFS